MNEVFEYKIKSGLHVNAAGKYVSKGKVRRTASQAAPFVRAGELELAAEKPVVTTANPGALVSPAQAGSAANAPAGDPAADKAAADKAAADKAAANNRPNPTPGQTG